MSDQTLPPVEPDPSPGAAVTPAAADVVSTPAAEAAEAASGTVAKPSQGRPAGQPPAAPPPGRFQLALKEILSGSWVTSVLAVLLAMVVGAVLVAAANPDVQSSASYLFARPSDFFGAVWESVKDAYVAMFQGAVVNFQGQDAVAFIKPITNTLTQATPLIFAGLGLAVGFRAGLFNIGAQGQIILGAIPCAWLGYALHLPPVVHLLVCVLGAMAGGALWGFIPGILKARTGANEVIVTIMLNSVAAFGVSYLLTLDAFQREGSNNPQTPLIDSTAQFPYIFGGRFTTHFGFILALLAAVFTWWLLDRSTLGFRFRALGENPQAARTAGINTNACFIWVMVIAGGLAGLAGAAQVQGTFHYLNSGVAASFGFDAITVALLGRSRPLGTVLAGLLFGGLKAAAPMVQSAAGSSDVVLVLQSVIVLLIAAPPLIRAVFRTPNPERVQALKLAAAAGPGEVAA
ncbi:MAG: ABC transporter permease [Bifidobacteriaceae bacterium]|jgi:simple sugar transport system permease protein|nr:ABC transporter permease [Bifidobacteriaceae bacterium]